VTGGCGSKSSTPPNRSKRRRIASARLGSRSCSVPTASASDVVRFTKNFVAKGGKCRNNDLATGSNRYQ
jgi:hypothetical protein